MTLNEYLKSKRISKSDFARSIGVEPHRVIEWSLGNKIPRAASLAKIEAATHGKVRAADFFRGDIKDAGKDIHGG